LQEKLGKLDVKKTASASVAHSGDKKSLPGSAAEAAISATNETVGTKKTDGSRLSRLSRRYHRNVHSFVDWDNDDVLQLYLTAQ
jgi:hypothetical protein